MKKYLLVLVLAAAASAWGGGPDVEMKEAFVDSIEKTPAGWIATVTGSLVVAVADPGKPEKRILVTLHADKAKVRVPGGIHLYLLSPSETDKYERRLGATVGKKTHVQMWGAALTIEAGRAVQIIAGDVSLLRPQKGEAAFDIGRLEEISAR